MYNTKIFQLSRNFFKSNIYTKVPVLKNHSQFIYSIIKSLQVNTEQLGTGTGYFRVPVQKVTGLAKPGLRIWIRKKNSDTDSTINVEQKNVIKTKNKFIKHW